ncbi:MAG: amidohydrolase family protein [Planctomycetes bacterium]|nr:amidohydrolase family protein [Planctomycetota bacterium]
MTTILRHSLLALTALALLRLGASAGDHPIETDALRKPRMHTGGTCVIRNVTIHSAVAPAFVGDVYVLNGDISAVGRTLDVPTGVITLDGTGKHLAPGVIDNHSHMAVDGTVNEGTLSITCDVDISDVIDPRDTTIYRALAGGVTTARILHGSANAIGGRHEVLKMKWGRRPSELVFPGAKEGVKFALGENPKQSNGGGGTRFPDSRMGVEALFFRAFARAREYAAEWRAYEEARGQGLDPMPPRRDVRLDVLRGILDGTVDVHSHCYRADEILMLLRVAETYGFKIKTLQHVLEGYKVAAEMAAAGAGGSTFGDWWAYKIEAYDGIPQNAAVMEQAGVLVSVNSDSEEMVRRLHGEAAKSVRYGGMDPVHALALVTLNSAKQLGIDGRVGSIEVGKDADLALFNGDPLSSLARVEWTMVDGEIEFERRDAFELDSRPPEVRQLPAAPAAESIWKADGGETIALVGGTVHPIDGPDLPQATLLLQDGRIVALGAEVAIPADARVIDVSGRHLWPGLVALNTPLGLFEIGSVPATDDMAEIGGHQPDLRASAALNADSAHLAVTRSNGVTRSQTSPQGGGPLMGQSCVIKLAGDTWEEMLTVDRDMLHIAFPRAANSAKEKKKSDEEKDLEKQFAAALDYGRMVDEAAAGGTAPPPLDRRLEALVPYARGQRKVALHASNAQTILNALRFAKEQKLDAVLYGATEGWKVVDALAREQRPVVVGPVLAVPGSAYDPYDAAFANAAVLARAGVPLALQTADRENPRNLAFHAAMASAFGLPRQEALRSITLDAARILGLDRELGSLTVGKRGDVIVTAGDLLDIRSPVEFVFVDGVQQSVKNRQTELYERYKARLEKLRATR